MTFGSLTVVNGWVASLVPRGGVAWSMSVFAVCVIEAGNSKGLEKTSENGRARKLFQKLAIFYGVLLGRFFVEAVFAGVRPFNLA
jgi:hypothetical protein